VGCRTINKGGQKKQFPLALSFVKLADGGNCLTAGLCVTALLIGVDVPDDVVGQAVDAVPGALGHLGEAFCLGLVLEGVAREVDS